MRSSRPYVLDRLREIFSAKIKAHEHYIEYRALPSLVRSKQLRSTKDRYSPYVQSIRDVVAEEICYGRLHLDVFSFPARLYFTPEGTASYANYRPRVVALATRPARRDGPFRQAAIDEYMEVADTVKSVQDTIGLFTVGDVNALDVHRLPQAVRSHLESEQALLSEKSNLVLNLHTLSEEIVDLREETLDFDIGERASTPTDEAGSLMYPDDDEGGDDTDDEILIDITRAGAAGPESDSDDDSSTRCSICGGSCCSGDLASEA